VVEADVLERVGYAADYVVLLDDGHGGAGPFRCCVNFRPAGRAGW
jgi:hypothetical protein